MSAVQQMVGNDGKGSGLTKSSKSHHIEPSPQDHKIADFLRANLESLEGLGLTSSNKVRRIRKSFSFVFIIFRYIKIIFFQKILINPYFRLFSLNPCA